MAWFGHTQTLTSISKSVTTVASGILGLEDNLATFMKKVIYYDKFFQRVGANLPKEVSSTAALLFARCYEYRSEIRDELESSLAYVADAGRWVVGMEDWNSKMDKRAHQISELVLLANSLLVEYAMTGRLGGDGSKDELDALLRNIAASVVLRNEKKPPRAPRAVAASPLPPSGSGSSHASSNAGSTTGSIESLSRPGSPPHARSDSASTPAAVASAERASVAPSASPQINGVAHSPSAPPADDCESDNDAFNPFACAYRAPPSAARDSLASSLASLANESTHSSVPDLAPDDTDARLNRSPSQRPQSRSHRGGGSEADDDGDDVDDDDDDGPGSPVHLCEYECLDMDAIPKFSVFKPSLRSRMQQQRLAACAPPSMSRSTGSIATAAATAAPRPGDSTGALHRSVPSLESEHRDSCTTAQAPTPLTHSSSSRAGTSHRRRSAPRVFDMSASYDFQREQAFNPFVSPPRAADCEPLSAGGSGSAPVGELERTRASRSAGDGDASSARDAPTAPLSDAETDTGDRRTRALDSAARPAPHLRDDEDDATSALIAAIAAASQDDDDFDLFGTGHAS